MSKFYRCKVCGNLVELIDEGKGTMVCCDTTMIELKANTFDAALEKHVPVVGIDKNIVTVNIGSVDHPMIPDHYIEWIHINTDSKVYRKKLNPGEKPNASFYIEEEGNIDVYAYCNLHSLWKSSIEK
ncbi:MAG: desulfoferrodoxin family protein [Clostridia bacterium]|nr:desulfoferrodoxin family protein [Clostridia bacterium]